MRTAEDNEGGGRGPKLGAAPTEVATVGGEEDPCGTFFPAEKVARGPEDAAGSGGLVSLCGRRPARELEGRDCSLWE